MAAQTYSARAVAKLVASRTGMPCDAKRVRAWSRSHLTRFDDDGYTTHAYSGAERDRIVNAMVAARKATATGPAARASSAARGRKTSPKSAPKSAKVPKVNPKSADASAASVEGPTA